MLGGVTCKFVDATCNLFVRPRKCVGCDRWRPLKILGVAAMVFAKVFLKVGLVI